MSRNEKETAGESGRPWLTLLHGFSQNARLFDRQRAHFEGRYRIFTPELLGHGGRDLRVNDYSVEAFARDVLTQLREHGVTRTHFWGTHTGSAVGLLLARDVPSLIASLVLEAPVVPGFDMPMVAARLARTREIARSQSVQAAMEDWFRHAEWFDVIRAHPERHRANEQRAIVREFAGHPLQVDSPAPAPFSSKQARAIQQSVMVYHGSEDIEDFKRTASWLREHLPHAELFDIPGLGGFPAWESPEVVNGIVDEFLSRVV